MHKLANVLLIEDNPADQYLTLEAFRESTWANRPQVVRDGLEAMSYLEAEGAFAARPQPDLILLDLHLPRKDGREVLKSIKEHPRHRYIPVVILTTSDQEQDVVACYGNHANCYIVKPPDLESFFQVVRQIENFWFGLSRLPRHES